MKSSGVTIQIKPRWQNFWIVVYISENFTTRKLFGFFCVMNVLEVSLLTTAVWSFLTDLICIPYSVYKGPLLFHDGLVIANG